MKVMITSDVFTEEAKKKIIDDYFEVIINSELGTKIVPFDEMFDVLCKRVNPVEFERYIE